MCTWALPSIQSIYQFPSHIFFHGIASQVSQPDSPSAALERQIGCVLRACLAAPPPCASSWPRRRSRDSPCCAATGTPPPSPSVAAAGVPNPEAKAKAAANVSRAAAAEKEALTIA